jgi:8-amino-3,8-dideoxy-alpha-D-manno-octulosonate transaminase
MPRMLPGALRLDESEEEAAVEATRAVMRSKRLYRFGGASINPFERSRVGELERSFARLTGAEHALAVNSGTSALVCGLIGMGIGPGDEVIVPAYTWFSTASSVLAAGAVPVVAEVDGSLTVDPEDLRRKLSPHTRAIIAVHMRGAPARMDGLMELAQENGLRVLEDAAQAVGGSFQGRALGTIGDAGAYSFGMHKIITAGEGGMLVTDDPSVHRRATMYHDSASPPNAGVAAEEWLPGVNLRMSELQGAILLVQLSRLEELLASMRARKSQLKQIVAERLEAKGVRFRTINDVEGDTSLALVFFLPDPARTEEVVSALADEKVPAWRLYQEMRYLPNDHIDLHAYPAWTPILDKRTWSREGGPWRWHPRQIEYGEGDCPRTMDLLRRAVQIDVSPELSPEQVEQMGATIAAVIEKRL